MCFIGWIFSFIYCTDSGLNLLNVVDFYINFVMLLVGFFEVRNKIFECYSLVFCTILQHVSSNNSRPLEVLGLTEWSIKLRRWERKP